MPAFKVMAKDKYYKCKKRIQDNFTNVVNRGGGSTQTERGDAVKKESMQIQILFSVLKSEF